MVLEVHNRYNYYEVVDSKKTKKQCPIAIRKGYRASDKLKIKDREKNSRTKTKSTSSRIIAGLASRLAGPHEEEYMLLLTHARMTCTAGQDSRFVMEPKVTYRQVGV